MFFARRQKTRFVSLICLAFLLGGCSLFSQETNYTLEGISSEDSELQTYMNAILEDRVKIDIDEDEESEEFKRAEDYREYTITNDLIAALKAKGYYEGQVEYVDDAENALTGTYFIKPGEQYTISSVQFEPAEYAEDFALGYVHEGAFLDAESVLKTQVAIKDILDKGTCYFKLDISHEVLLDKASKTGALTYRLDIGQEATFGPTIFEGATSVENEYLQKLVPWKEGDCYRARRIERLKTVLMESGLFSKAESRLPEAPDENGVVPVTISVQERAHRSIKGGLSYYTDEGVGVALGWEHRNFLGQAEKLSAQLTASQIKQSLVFDFTKPYFLRKDQSLSLNTTFKREDSDAFEELGVEVGAALNRKFGSHVTGSAGVNFSISQIEDSFGRETYGLVSFPTSLVFDNRDDSLNPEKGWLASLKVKPVLDAFGQSDPFTKIEMGARTYLKPLDSAAFIIALRADTGTILGGDIETIPASERFFAGGGGSVRGFGYQEVGPYLDGEPSGGLSFATGSLEFRTKFTQSLGGVAFVDAGSVSETTSPDFSNLAVGAGLGVRYYTDFGPIRFDIAVPLTEKENLDQNYQFYISIGQAF